MRRLSPLLLIALVSVASAKKEPARPQPPVAKKVAYQNTGGGHTREDNYHWLQTKTDPEVRAYLEAENAYAAAVMAPTARLQEKLYGEMLGRIQEDDSEVPYREGAYFLYTRTEKGKQYKIHARKKDSLEAREEVVLDVNQLAKGKQFMAVGAYQFSDGGRMLAYSTDDNGFRDYVLHVRDTASGKDLEERVERVTDVAWASDGKTLFYVTTDPAKRPYRLWRHVLHENAADALVYEEKDERFDVSLERSRTGDYFFITSASHTTSEVRVLRTDQPSSAPTLISPRRQDREYYVDHLGDSFFIRVNDTGRNYRVVTAPVSSPGEKAWKELIPQRDDVMVEDLQLLTDHCMLWERAGGLPRLRILNLASGNAREVPMDEAAFDASAGPNHVMNSNTYRFNYESMTTPVSTYDVDIDTFEKKLLKRKPVVGYDPGRYATERITATASDGTNVPVSIVYKKGVEKNGKAALLLRGYGAYGLSQAVRFDSERVSLLDRGVIYAIAHVRGGGELGKKWHDAGRMANKINTFTDFVACAEHLIAQKYTSRERLAITGGSAGGLLMGAVLNMRPELFKAALVYVPFVDVLSTELDESLPLTVGEFEEWGNPKIPEQYDYIARYSPYDNLKAQAYPAMLVRTSLNDSQVMYFEPAKWVAKLRATRTDEHALMLKTEMVAGHGGASGRYDALRDKAHDFAFVLVELGVEPVAGAW